MRLTCRCRTDSFSSAYVGGGAIFPEQFCRHDVDEIVARLRRENQRHEQFERV